MLTSTPCQTQTSWRDLRHFPLIKMWSILLTVEPSWILCELMDVSVWEDFISGLYFLISMIICAVFDHGADFPCNSMLGLSPTESPGLMVVSVWNKNYGLQPIAKGDDHGDDHGRDRVMPHTHRRSRSGDSLNTLWLWHTHKLQAAIKWVRLFVLIGWRDGGIASSAINHSEIMHIFHTQGKPKKMVHRHWCTGQTS